LTCNSTFIESEFRTEALPQGVHSLSCDDIDLSAHIDTLTVEIVVTSPGIALTNPRSHLIGRFFTYPSGTRILRQQCILWLAHILFYDVTSAWQYDTVQKHGCSGIMSVAELKIK